MDKKKEHKTVKFEKCPKCGEKWSPRHFWYCKGDKNG